MTGQTTAPDRVWSIVLAGSEGYATFFNMSNFEQTAVCLLGMFPLTLAIC